jgi:hypothetical protein
VVTEDAAAAACLAAAHAMVGEHERAIACAREAVALEPTARHRNTLAGILIAAGEADEAATVLHGLLAEHPEDRDAHINLATAAFQLADHGTAMTSNARAFELDPSDRRPLRNLMSMFAEIGKWLGAMAALELSRRGTPPPEVEVALDLIAIELVELLGRDFPPPGIDAEADATVARLVANAPSRPPSTQLVIARALADIGRFAELRTIASGLARGDALAAADRGNLHYVEGLLAEYDRAPARALDRYAAALAADAHRADACVNATALLLAQGDAALPRIGALLDQVAPDERAATPGLLFNESIYLRRAGRPGEARARLEQVLGMTGGGDPVAALARAALAELAA